MAPGRYRDRRGPRAAGETGRAAQDFDLGGGFHYSRVVTVPYAVFQHSGVERGRAGHRRATRPDTRQAAGAGRVPGPYHGIRTENPAATALTVNETKSASNGERGQRAVKISLALPNRSRSPGGVAVRYAVHL